MSGEGEYAQLLAKRFALCEQRFELNRPGAGDLATDRFRRTALAQQTLF
jgi:hypothetical protein